MNANVTAAFQQHLAQRKANIMNMFTNPHDALGDEVSKAEETEEVEEVEETEEEDGVKKGCGDGNKNIEKEETEEEDDDEKTDAEKAEIISLIGIEQLDAWNSAINDLADEYCFIRKARSGVYADTAENRKLGRVGQQYGGKKKEEERGAKKSTATGVNKEALAAKKRFIDEIKDDGADKYTSWFLTKNQEYFKDYLNKQGFEDWDAFEDWGSEGADDDWDKYNKIFMQCTKRVPADKFVDFYKKAQDNDIEKSYKVAALDREIQDFADINGITKSDIMYALNGYETKIKFRKSGKEIKEQLNSVVIPALNADLAIAKSEADAVLKKCGDAPTHDVPEYWTGDLKIDLDYKFYEWDETRVPDTNNTGIVSSFSPESYKSRCCKNAAATQEEADARCKYNECVRKIANITTDIKACQIVAKNLKDNESVELTVRQLVAFKFA